MLFLLFGCALAPYSYTPCDNDGQCRAAFGIGHVCGKSGLCEEVPPNNRCTTTYPEDLLSNPSAHKDDILLGSLFSLDPVDGDVEESKAVELAVHQVDEEQGLDGRLYSLVQCDYTEDPSIDSLTGTEAVKGDADWLAKMGVPVVVGPATSSMSQDAFAVTDPNGTLIISPSATSPALTDIDGITHSDADPGLFWRTAPPDDLQGLVIAQDIAGHDISKVAVIFEASNYGQALADVFKQYFEASGGRTADLYSFDEGSDSGRDTQVVTVGQASYEEVLFISGSIDDYVAFLNAAKDLSGYADMPLFFADAARDSQLLNGTPQAKALYANIRGSAPSVPSGVLYDFFKSSFDAAYSPLSADGSSYTAYSYDAAWLAIYGSVWSAHRESDSCTDDDDGICGLGIARGLRKVSSGTEVDVKSTTWNTVKASFEAGQSVDLEGASGHLNFDPVTEETTGPVDIWVVNADATGFETEQTIDPSGS